MLKLFLSLGTYIINLFAKAFAVTFLLALVAIVFTGKAIGIDAATNVCTVAILAMAVVDILSVIVLVFLAKKA
jgi:hypothetical protein